MLHRFEVFWVFVATTSNSEVVLPVGDYVPQNPAGTKIRGWVELRGEIGSASAAVGATQANDITAAGTTTKACAFVTSEGVGNPDSPPISYDASGGKFVRPCIVLKSGTADTLAGGMVRGVIEIWST
jgi:hypothetical protein